MDSQKLLKFVNSRIVGYSIFLTIGATLGTVVGLFGKYHFLTDLCTHFRLLSTPALLICGILILIFGKRKWIGMVGFVIGLSLLGTFVPYFGIGQQNQNETHNLRIMSYNVLTSNPAKDQVADYILSESPDLAIILEVDSVWSAALTRRLGTTYPHTVVRNRGDNFGIAAFSKVPFVSTEIRDFGDNVTPSLDLRFDSLRVIGTHPVPPTNQYYWKSRNRQMQAIAEDIAATGGPTIVCGDFNCSQWSPFMKQFLETSGLEDPSKSFGIKPTWTVLGGIVGLPIDHFFNSKDLKALNRRIGKKNGSDHKPITMDYLIKGW